MIYLDWWYGEPQNPENVDVAVNFYPNDGLYKGNMYKRGTNRCIGDFISDDSVAIEQYWPNIFKGEDEMNKLEKIEKIIKELIKAKESSKNMVRYYQHKIDDAKEDGRDYPVRAAERQIAQHMEKVKELEVLIDFMQELHYEEVK